VPKDPPKTPPKQEKSHFSKKKTSKKFAGFEKSSTFATALREVLL